MKELEELKEEQSIIVINELDAMQRDQALIDLQLLLRGVIGHQ